MDNSEMMFELADRLKALRDEKRTPSSVSRI